MAEIEIERSRRPVWPWVIVGVLVLALVVYGIMEWMRTDEQVVATETYEQPAQPVPTQPAAPAGELGALEQWGRDAEAAFTDPNRVAAQTRDGIERLARAIEEVASRQGIADIQQRTERLREHGRQIDGAPEQGATHARTAFVEGVQILDDLRQQPHLQQANLQQPLSNARGAAESIREDVPLQQQGERVREYFQHMTSALRLAVQPH